MKKSYEKMKAIQLAVLDRDNNRCLCCNRHTGAPPHHIKYKSHGGADDMDNMATVCMECHHTIHDGGRSRHVVQEVLNSYGPKSTLAYILKGMVTGL